MFNKMRSLYMEIFKCFGVVKVSGYKRMSLADPKEERLVRPKGVCGEHNSAFVTPLAHSEKASLLLRFAFDASAKDTRKDRYHHTMLSVGDAISGELRGDITILGSKKDVDTGKFQPMAPLEFDCLFPQVPDGMGEEYIEDRMIIGELQHKLDKYIKKMKDLGLYPKRPYSKNDDAEETFRVENYDATVKIQTPTSGRVSWKSMTNKEIRKEYGILTARIAEYRIKWKALTGLSEVRIKDSQVFRVLDMGMYETARMGSVVKIGSKSFPVYLNAATFAEYAAKGRINVDESSDTLKGVLVV